MRESTFDSDDVRQLEGRGIPVDEARRQLATLSRPPIYTVLDRPATVGDGIVRIDEADRDELRRLHEEAAGEGRFVKFVPASGAATRMFKELFHFQRGPGRGWTRAEIRGAAAEGETEAGVLEQFFADLLRLPFRANLDAALDGRLEEKVANGEIAPILDALLSIDGLSYGDLPKGLIEFHSYPEGSRTPFEEHMVEAGRYARSRDGVCRLHLTVSPQHLEGFDELLAKVRSRYESNLETRFEVTYSVQKPSTDTLASDLDGCPWRDDAGRLRFRPGGHGALIENLHELGADLIFVKNIDNVQPDHLKEATLTWKPLLAGHLVRLQRRVFECLRRLRADDGDGGATARALELITTELGVEPPTLSEMTPDAQRAWALDRLDRPIRVCGVVPNTGEPGGGPFRVRHADGSTDLQIVEPAQVEPGRDDQVEMVRRSTHFNPVDLVCAVRDLDGKPHDLHRYIDPDTAIVTTKSAEGKELQVLERPGLWNGAMAGWNSVFVETPLATFSPVKSVLDLLRVEHQPPVA